MRVIRRFLLVLVLFAVLTGGYGVVRAQEKTEEYFPQQGFVIKDEFYRFYYSVRDPLAVFGYPISNQLMHKETGVISQYFQKARFDLINGKIQLADLGQMMYGSPGQLASYSANPLACRTFAATRKKVCYSFLEFYDHYDGPVVLGNPISDVEIRDGRYMQYFERGRLEWRPRLSTGERVAVGDLGWLHYQLNENKFSEVAPIGNIPQPGNPTNADSAEIQVKPQVSAFVSSALLSPGSDQTLFVIVQDQYYRPISGAMVLVSFSYPDGKVVDERLELTNQDGITSRVYRVDGLSFNQVVEIHVSVNYEGLKSETSTWYRMWW